MRVLRQPEGESRPRGYRVAIEGVLQDDRRGSARRAKGFSKTIEGVLRLRPLGMIICLRHQLSCVSIRQAGGEPLSQPCQKLTAMTTAEQGPRTRRSWPRRQRPVRRSSRGWPSTANGAETLRPDGFRATMTCWVPVVRR